MLLNLIKFALFECWLNLIADNSKTWADSASSNRLKRILSWNINIYQTYDRLTGVGFWRLVFLFVLVFVCSHPRFWFCSVPFCWNGFSFLGLCNKWITRADKTHGCFFSLCIWYVKHRCAFSHVRIKLAFVTCWWCGVLLLYVISCMDAFPFTRMLYL